MVGSIVHALTMLCNSLLSSQSQQSSLKSTFFKQPALKTAANGDGSPPAVTSSLANDRDLPTVGESESKATEANGHVADHVTSERGDIAESVKQNTKQKLADLAFKPASEP